MLHIYCQAPCVGRKAVSLRLQCHCHDTRPFLHGLHSLPLYIWVITTLTYGTCRVDTGLWTVATLLYGHAWRFCLPLPLRPPLSQSRNFQRQIQSITASMAARPRPILWQRKTFQSQPRQNCASLPFLVVKDTHRIPTRISS